MEAEWNGSGMGGVGLHDSAFPPHTQNDARLAAASVSPAAIVSLPPEPIIPPLPPSSPLVTQLSSLASQMQRYVVPKTLISAEREARPIVSRTCEIQLQISTWFWLAWFTNTTASVQRASRTTMPSNGVRTRVVCLPH